MASNKFIALVFLFVTLMAAPIAQAQLGLGGLLGGLLGGGLGDLLGGGGGGGPLGLIRILGNVSCSLDGSSGVGTPVFPNALVQLQCGGSVVSSTRTNSNGLFSIILDPTTTIQNILQPLLSGCNIVVKTPLSTCNASLPSVGGLVSRLQSLGNIISGILSIANISPTGFQFNQNLN